MFIWPALALAQNSKDKTTFIPQVTIPGPEGGATSLFQKAGAYILDGTTKPICDYIIAIYKYIIGIVGILAAMTFIIGAVIYLTSAGNASRVGEAKSWMISSLLGLLLALGAYLILATVSNNLLVCKIDKIKSLGYVESINQQATNTSCSQTEVYTTQLFNKQGPEYNCFVDKSKTLSGKLIPREFCTQETERVWNDWSPPALNRLSVWVANFATRGLLRTVIGPFGWGQLLSGDTRRVQLCCCTNTESLPDGPSCKAASGEDIDKYDGKFCRVKGGWGECENGICKPNPADKVWLDNYENW